VVDVHGLVIDDPLHHLVASGIGMERGGQMLLGQMLLGQCVEDAVAVTVSRADVVSWLNCEG
jgi:hypothetical protein